MVVLIPKFIYKRRTSKTRTPNYPQVIIKAVSRRYPKPGLIRATLKSSLVNIPCYPEPSPMKPEIITIVYVINDHRQSTSKASNININNYVDPRNPKRKTEFQSDLHKNPDLSSLPQYHYWHPLLPSPTLSSPHP